jgi:CRP/FNR family transcriptional regulator, cyclic AMP receptor protein
MRTMKFKAGDTIIAQGDDGDTAYLISDGSVDVMIGEGAKLKKIGTLETGDVFGEMSLLEPGPRSATVTAATDTECVVTNYEEFINSLEKNPERAVDFMKTLVRRLRHMNELVMSMDPKRRGFRDIMRDWQKAFEFDEESMSEDERQRYYEMMLYGMRGPYG